MAKRPTINTFTDRVRERIIAELQGGNPGVEGIAAKLHMRAKTSHRRLKEAGTNHRELLDSLRAELAEHYLGEHGLALSEVAFLLGFSEASAFHRAFKPVFELWPKR